jgi:hypothetical protein
MSTSNRRAFLQALGRRAARDAREVAQAAGPLLGAASPAGVVRAALTTRDAGPQDAPARPADRDEVLALIHGEGLGHREDDVVGLIRPVVRLSAVAPGTPVAAWANTAAIDLGGTLVRVDRSAPQLRDTPLAGEGWCELAVEPDGDDELVVRATVLDQAPATGPSLQPMDLIACLALPPVWTPAVRDLGLAGYDHDAYVSLRKRLADAQGLDLDAVGEPTNDRQADWRPLAELAADGVVVGIWAADATLDHLVALIG